MTIASDQSPGPIAEEMFDDLPGGPWRKPPPANYDGMFATAMVVRHGLKNQAGVLDFRPFGMKERLSVEYLATSLDASEKRHVFHFVGDQFEVLMIIASDLLGASIFCRGSRTELQQAAERLDVACSEALSGLAPGRQSQSNSRVKLR